MISTSRRLVYLDASALVKLVLIEAESGALQQYLADVPRLATSTVATIEVPLARRGGRRERTAPSTP